MIDKGKRNILGVLVNAVDYEAAVSTIISAAQNSSPLAVSALAVHGVMTGVLDSTHRHRLNHLDLIVPDGQPVRWALNRLYATQLPDRVYGPLLMLKVCERAVQEDLSIFLYGSSNSVLQSLKHSLRKRFPTIRIAGSQSSAFRKVSEEERNETIERIRESGAALTFVGLGCPKQEVWVYENRDSLQMPVLAVGAAFDFHAGNLPQAPAFLQRFGLEWLFRLTREPLRLWKRYVLLNPLFVLLFLLQLSGVFRFDPERCRAPLRPLNYG